MDRVSESGGFQNSIHRSTVVPQTIRGGDQARTKRLAVKVSDGQRHAKLHFAYIYLHKGKKSRLPSRPTAGLLTGAKGRQLIAAAPPSTFGDSS